MKGTRSAVVKTTACIVLAGGLVAVASVSLSGGPAFAASPNEAYAASASGPVSISPVAEATYPGTSPGSVASISSGTLITAGAVTDTADATDASSTIANLNVGLSALVALTSDDVASSCSFNTNTDTVRRHHHHQREHRPHAAGHHHAGVQSGTEHHGGRIGLAGHDRA